MSRFMLPAAMALICAVTALMLSGCGGWASYACNLNAQEIADLQASLLTKVPKELGGGLRMGAPQPGSICDEDDEAVWVDVSVARIKSADHLIRELREEGWVIQNADELKFMKESGGRKFLCYVMAGDPIRGWIDLVFEFE